ncbi:S-locus-specific glycoprotein S14 (Fragment) [Linum perenne]
MKPNLTLFFSFISLFPILYSAADFLTTDKSLHKNRTLLSGRQIFELGFFSPGETVNWYFSIWYKKIPEQTFVWVPIAIPLPGTTPSADFKIDNPSPINQITNRAEPKIQATRRTERGTRRRKETPPCEDWRWRK